MTALHVAFRVGNADYAIAATEVLHLEAFESATHVPGAPSYVAGLVQTRGQVVPVVDLRARFGLGAAEHTADRRVVVVKVGSRVAGLLVDSAREVLQIDEAAIAKPPELIDDQAGGFVRAIATVTKRMFLLVDVPRVLGEELSHGH
jgi:purine-binding chemotaxis protein CheW